MSPNGSDSLAWVKWFEADFRLSTGGWPRDARAIYRVLLQENWYRGQLPKDLNELARLCEYPPAEFEPLWQTYIAAKFKRKRGGWTNARIERDRAEALRKSAEARRAAATRWGRGPQDVGQRVLDLTDRFKHPDRPKK